MLLLTFVLLAGTALVHSQASNSNNNNKNVCQNLWKFPEDCQMPNCTYQIVWRYKQPEDSIEFTISSKHPERWTGIIFSQDRTISSSDGIFAWIDNNSYVLMDAHLPNIHQAIGDSEQSVTDIQAQLSNGIGIFRFTRERDTKDSQDMSFADSAPCPFFVFPVDGGTVDLKTRKIVTDEHSVYISDRRICIRACDQQKANATTQKPSSTTTTTTTTTMKPIVTTSAPLQTTTTRKPTTTTTTTSTTTAPKQKSSGATTLSTSTTTTPPKQKSSSPTATSSTSTTSAAPTTTTSTSTTSTTTSTTTTTTPAPTSSRQQQQSGDNQLANRQTGGGPKNDQWCAGRWSHPPNCAFKPSVPSDALAYLQTPIDSSFNIRPLPIEHSDCGYYAQWQYLEPTDSIEFIIQTKTRNRWTGIGFSNGTKMANSDAIIGLIEEHSGRHFIMDTWLRDHVMPEIDQQQNTRQTSGKRENGTTTVRFRRQRLTGDQQDFQFSDNSCAYFFFPTQGGSFNAISKRMHKHEAIPSVSENRICVKSCSPNGSLNKLAATQATTTAPLSATGVNSQPDTTTTTTTTNNSSSQQAAGPTDQNQATPSTTTSSSSSTTTTTTAATSTSTSTSTASGSPNLFYVQDQSSSSGPSKADKGLDQTNISQPPSNDLSVDLDTANGGGQQATATTTTGVTSTAATTSTGQANFFSRLAFLSEPSLRWIAGIGCVFTLLAVIVFQACFTVYKNKQAYKQNLYRQSAFKQNAYLHGAYLRGSEAANSVLDTSNGIVPIGAGLKYQSSLGAANNSGSQASQTTTNTTATATNNTMNERSSVNGVGGGGMMQHHHTKRPANHLHANHHNSRGPPLASHYAAPGLHHDDFDEKLALGDDDHELMRGHRRIMRHQHDILDQGQLLEDELVDEEEEEEDDEEDYDDLMEEDYDEEEDEDEMMMNAQEAQHYAVQQPPLVHHHHHNHHRHRHPQAQLALEQPHHHRHAYPHQHSHPHPHHHHNHHQRLHRQAAEFQQHPAFGPGPPGNQSYAHHRPQQQATGAGLRPIARSSPHRSHHHHHNSNLSGQQHPHHLNYANRMQKYQ